MRRGTNNRHLGLVPGGRRTLDVHEMRIERTGGCLRLNEEVYTMRWFPMLGPDIGSRERPALPQLTTT
jgi:hypothetical protein